MDDSSGILGIIGILGCILLFFIGRRLFPSVTIALLVILGILAFFLLLLVAAVLFFAFAPQRKQRRNNKEAADSANALAKGRSDLIDLRRLLIRIKHKDIHSASELTINTIDGIMRTLREHPEKLSSVRQLLNYYLPTMVKILRKYVLMEENGIPDAQIMNSVLSCLNDIQIALIRLYDNMFLDDKLDLSVEMETLTRVCKRDGLLTDDDFTSNQIQLTL